MLIYDFKNILIKDFKNVFIHPLVPTHIILAVFISSTI